MAIHPPHTYRHNRLRTWPRLLETLEARTLLSAAILVTGNGAAIANHDMTPALGNFTDFGPMSTTVSAAIGTVTRSFVITDTGDANLALTGGAKQIQITGANAKDFVLTVNAAAAIPVGMHSGFTISFVPKGAGLRKATVTILSNDPAAPAFTFNIQGSGLKTTTSATGLQAGTAVKGLGSGAFSGASITFNYTAFLRSSKLESTLDPGNAALTMLLGQSAVIPGWTQGFAGLKAGETRLLVLPASLGFGANGNGNIPANASLIYQVTAVSVANPAIVVSGHTIPIAFGDKTPNAADGTFIGAAPAGSIAPLSFTFKISNGSDGKVAFTSSPTVVLVTKNITNFATTDITIDPSFDFATFTVTYTPAIAGTQTAVVHVRSTDPIHPDYTFTVSGTSAPFLDLSPVSVGTINYPASGNIVSGAATKFKVPLTITNLGNAAVPGQTPPVQINFYLHDTTSGADTLISSQTVTNLRGTARGQSKLVNLNVTVPGTILTGSYKLLAKINENAAVSETNLLNDSVLSSQIVNVTQGFFNVDGVLSTSTFPTTIATVLPLSGKLSVLVRNVGNLTLPAGQKFTLQVLAHPDVGADIVIGSSTITLSSWVPLKTALLTVATKSFTGLTAGHYELQALLTPVLPLTESSTTDNRVTANGLGGDVELTVT